MPQVILEMRSKKERRIYYQAAPKLLEACLVNVGDGEYSFPHNFCGIEVQMMVNVNPSTHTYEKKESFLFIYSGYHFFFGLLVHLYSIPNIFFVYINDASRLFAILLWGSYLIVSVISAYVDYRFLDNNRLSTYSFVFTAGLWSMVAINLYGIQALVDQPFYQELYINLLWIQLLFILFSWIKWIPVRTRERIARIVTIILGAFFMFHLLGIFASTKGMGIYVFLFGKEVAVALTWPGIALFFSGFWTRLIMGAGIDLDITPEERARRIAEEKAREEASIRKVSEEMLSSGRYLEYGELDYYITEGISNYREKGSKTFEYVEFLYVENGVRYFNRLNWTPPKEMILYKENGQWYCQTTGQERERVLLPEHLEEEKDEFEIDKREYLEQAIEYRRIVPYFVEIPSDIDESEIDRGG
ncbi:hypothetical protein JOC94_004151 [Bacillus thermophilus]|uniref:Uncharacterized protein n=1 Tax=Siminovitchia thermophila TaxID=1245522 RepID=A0ABS2RBU5_9BACI|nr:hypothetical protein [Siminovitchia thermophila]MBM7717126.1 hypothetical protein [Siminovitchia thermophila]